MPLDPEELLEHADRLAGDATATQADLRRAISAAYYAIFHFCLTAAADMAVGAAVRSTAEYILVYRSIDHSRLRGLCDRLRGTKPGNLAITPAGGFGDMAKFARIAFNLYEQRILADYDPTMTCSGSEVRLAVSDVREAIAWFKSCGREQQRAFLAMLLFKARSPP